jgi:hypothetical protein
MVAVSCRNLVLWGGAILVAVAGLCVVRAASGRNSEHFTLAGTPICSAQAAGIEESERSFLTENQRAMDRKAG